MQNKPYFELRHNVEAVGKFSSKNKRKNLLRIGNENLFQYVTAYILKMLSERQRPMFFTNLCTQNFFNSHIK